MELQITRDAQGPVVLVPSNETQTVGELLRRRNVETSVKHVLAADGPLPGLDALVLPEGFDLDVVNDVLGRWNETGRSEWQKAGGRQPKRD